MSLLSNRGRFSKDEKNITFDAGNRGEKSNISSFGTNPTNLFKLGINNSVEDIDNVKVDSKNEDKDVNEEEKNKLYNLDSGWSSIDKDSKEFLDNGFAGKTTKKIIDKKFNINKKENNTDKKGIFYDGKWKLFIIMAVVEIITIIAIVNIGSFVRLKDMTQKVSFSKEAVKNTEIAETTLAVMEGYETIVVFGLDSRSGSVDKGNNSDVNLIANLNLATGDAQLVSVYRDFYLSTDDNNNYDKINAAYRKNGPEGAVKALNKNLDLNIDSFFAFNWKAVADGIELLGGIDLEITKAEFKYMNAFIHETCKATGIDAKNPAAHYIKKSGMNHLDGVQAVAYGRLRLMDSDFRRVERQKKVVELCLEKAKNLEISELRLILEAVLPQIAYEFDMDKLLAILKIIKKINITESVGCPETSNMVMMDMGGSGDCIVPLSLEKAVKKLHKVLFDVDDYTPSTQVKRYSNRIIELRRKYAEENAIKSGQISQTDVIDAMDTMVNDITSAKPKDVSATSKPKTTSVNKNTTVTTQASSVAQTNVVPKIDSTVYPEEPEEDLPTPNNNINNSINVSPTPNANQSHINNQNNNTAVRVDAPMTNNFQNNMPSNSQGNVPVQQMSPNTNNTSSLQENINRAVQQRFPGSNVGAVQQISPGGNVGGVYNGPSGSGGPVNGGGPVSSGGPMSSGGSVGSSSPISGGSPINSGGPTPMANSSGPPIMG